MCSLVLSSMLSVIMLDVFMLSVIMMNVVVPVSGPKGASLGCAPATTGNVRIGQTQSELEGNTN